MKINCLRIGSLPTSHSPGAGLATLELAKIEDLNTTLLATISRDELLPDTDLSEFENVIFLKPNFSNRFISRLILVNKLLLTLTFFVFQKSFSIVHCHSFLAAPFCLIFSVLMGVRTLYTFHGSDFHSVINSSLYLRAMLYYEKILFVSQADLAHFREILAKKSISKDRLYAVGNGFDLIDNFVSICFTFFL